MTTALRTTVLRSATRRSPCTRGAVVALWAGLCGACIIPDAGIVVEDEFLNPGAVRIVEPTPITARADEDCDERTLLRACPNIPDTVPSGLIRPAQPLCICPPGERTPFGAGFDLFVEDPDLDDEGNAKDEVLGALLLDLPPDAEDPRDSLAYTNLLPPEQPARLYRAADVPTIERPDPHLKSWPLALLGDFDLCNDNDGESIGGGLHELRLIVTDRPWYRPAMLDADGEPVYDDNGEVMYYDPVFGMPDLRAGATYDTATYVFRCYDPMEETLPEGIECNCES